MKSMTGYGRGECARDGFKVTVELNSVNRRQTEISVNLPREMEMLEAPIRDLINRHVARGRLTVRVSLHTAAGKSTARMHLNLPLAKAYALELEQLANHLKLAGPVTLALLRRGRQLCAKGKRLRRPPLGHCRGTHAPAKPLRAVRRLRQVRRAGGPD